MTAPITDAFGGITEHLQELAQPRCTIRNCRHGNPEATHFKAVILPCHRADAFMCAHCTRRERRALERKAARPRGVRCGACGAAYPWITYGAAVEIVPL